MSTIQGLPVETSIVISAATFDPNPVSFNSSTMLKVTIEETQIIPGEHWFTGEIYSGEV